MQNFVGDITRWTQPTVDHAHGCGLMTFRFSHHSDRQVNRAIALPYNLRVLDFEAAMQDVYDFFFDVNTHLRERNLPRLEDMLRPANLQRARFSLTRWVPSFSCGP